VAGEADDDLPMFWCGDVAEGGGRSCLEIDRDGLCDMDALAEENDSTEIKELFVFHGGGHHTDSFAFDQRVSSPTGERAILPFDRHMQRLPKRAKADRIQPFGLWLHKRVSTLARTVERNLREVN